MSVKMNKKEEAVLRLENIKPFVGENVKEALDMAIEELKKKPCEDAVSREEVLSLMEMRLSGKEIFDSVYNLPSVQPVALIGCVKFDEDKLSEIVEEAVKNIKVEYCWHPVSELPKKDGDYLVSVVDEFGKRVISSYYGSLTGWVTIYDVEAWMESPKVYKGDEE